MFCKKRSYQKFHRKFAKVAGLGLQLYYKETPTQVFSYEICGIFKNTYFEEHLRATAPEFIGDTTFFHETILKTHANGKTSFQDGKEYNQKQHFE